MVSAPPWGSPGPRPSGAAASPQPAQVGPSLLPQAPGPCALPRPRGSSSSRAVFPQAPHSHPPLLLPACLAVPLAKQRSEMLDLS